MFYKRLNLRGHHLLCVFGWRGFGYSEKFNRAMDAVVEKIRQGDAVIETKAGPDQLCKECPNISESGCFKDNQTKEKQIQAHDRRVLDFLGLRPGQQISVSQLKSQISQRKTYENLSYLCENCSWLEKDYCYKGQKSVHTG